jgi:hypothetical protein
VTLSSQFACSHSHWGDGVWRATSRGMAKDEPSSWRGRGAQARHPLPSNPSAMYFNFFIKIRKILQTKLDLGFSDGPT